MEHGLARRWKVTAKTWLFLMESKKYAVVLIMWPLV
jgi:hypothetical protein